MPDDVTEMFLPAAQPPRRRNERFYAAVSATAALIMLAFLAVMLGIVARWAAHITGVWPL